MKIEMSVDRRLGSFGAAFRAGTIFAIALLSSSDAYAVSERVKSACRNDYFEHCSQYAVDTEELRQCMRKVGEDLSTPCLVALVQDGEITKEDVARHNAAKEAGATKKKTELAKEDPGDPKSAGTKPPKKKIKSKKHAKKEAEATGGAKTAAEAKSAGEAKAEGDAKAPGKSKKTAKGTKTHKAGTKAKTAGISPESKPSTKKKDKNAKTGPALAAVASTDPKLVAGSAAPAHKKAGHKSTHKKSATAKVQSGTKKAAAPAAVKKKQPSKKKSAKKHAVKPVDAAAP